jgi:hypothetical protein
MVRYMLLLLLLMAAVPLCAQEDVLYPFPPPPDSLPSEHSDLFPLNFGIEFGSSYSFFSQNIDYFPVDNPTSPQKVLASGSGVGGFAALQAELPLGSTFALQGRVGYELKRFASSGEGIADCPSTVAQHDTMTIYARREMNTSFVSAGMFLRANLGENAFVTLGPVMHRWLGSLFVHDRLEILTPGNCVYFDGKKVAEADSTDNESVNRTRFGLEGGIGASIPLSDKLWLAPALRYQFMFTPFAPDRTGTDPFRSGSLGELDFTFTRRMLHALHLGIGLWWNP